MSLSLFISSLLETSVEYDAFQYESDVVLLARSIMLVVHDSHVFGNPHDSQKLMSVRDNLIIDGAHPVATQMRLVMYIKEYHILRHLYEKHGLEWFRDRFTQFWKQHNDVSWDDVSKELDESLQTLSEIFQNWS